MYLYTTNFLKFFINIKILNASLFQYLFLFYNCFKNRFEKKNVLELKGNKKLKEKQKQKKGKVYCICKTEKYTK